MLVPFKTVGDVRKAHNKLRNKVLQQHITSGKDQFEDYVVACYEEVSRREEHLLEHRGGKKGNILFPTKTAAESGWSYFVLAVFLQDLTDKFPDSSELLNYELFEDYVTEEVSKAHNIHRDEFPYDYIDWEELAEDAKTEFLMCHLHSRAEYPFATYLVKLPGSEFPL